MIKKITQFFKKRPRVKQPDPDIQTADQAIEHHRKKLYRYKAKLKKLRQENKADTEQYQNIFTAFHYYKHLIKISGE